jgi:hypothetical protein
MSEDIFYIDNKCMAILESGEKCANAAADGSPFCDLHRKPEPEKRRWQGATIDEYAGVAGDTEAPASIQIPERAVYQVEDKGFIVDHLANSCLYRVGQCADNSPDQRFTSNRDYWKAVLLQPSMTFRNVMLENFQIVDWFPRSPGLYHTANAALLRSTAFENANTANGVTIFSPHGKNQMVRGGIGSIRLSPHTLNGDLCWFTTATSDGFCHSGIPLAIPEDLLGKTIGKNGFDSSRWFDVIGQVRAIPDSMNEYLDQSYVRVPLTYVKVGELRPDRPKANSRPVSISPMAYFVSNEGQGVTFFSCFADNYGAVDNAAEWIGDYVTKEKGEILTDFDQQRRLFGGLPLGLDEVMRGRVEAEVLHQLFGSFGHRMKKYGVYRAKQLAQHLKENIRFRERPWVFAKPLEGPEEAASLAAELDTIPTGNADAGRYHTFILKALEMIFNPFLYNPVKEQEIDEGRKRVDIVFDNGATAGFFYDLNQLHHIKCPYVFIECKNYSSDPRNPEIDQLLGRFSRARGQFGILVCRRIEDNALFLQRCKDAFNNRHDVIIALEDADIESMLRYRAIHDLRLLDELLAAKYRSLVF